MEVAELVELLALRSRILTRLLAGDVDRRELKDAVPESRATVYRSLEQLEEYDIVRERDGNHELTTFGRYVTEAFVEFEHMIEGVIAARDLLEGLPNDQLLPVDFFRGADVRTSEPFAPLYPIQQIEDEIEHSTTVDVFSPVVFPELLSILEDGCECCDRTVELYLGPRVVSHMKRERTSQLAELTARESTTVYEIDDHVPVGIILSEDGTSETWLLAYDESGSIKGVVHSETDIAIEWATTMFRQFRENATRVTSTSPAR